MPSKPKDITSANFTRGNNTRDSGKQPKSYKWLSPRNWKLNAKNSNIQNQHQQKTAVWSPEQELKLEADWKELAAWTTAAAATTTTATKATPADGNHRRNGTVVDLWSVEALQKLLAQGGEQPWRTSSSSVASPSPKVPRQAGSNSTTTNHNKSVGIAAQIVLVQDHLNSNSRQLALKRLPSPGSPSSSRTTQKKNIDLQKRLATAELVREAKILARVGKHPNILALRGLPTVSDGLLSSCVNDGAFFFLTDPLHRETLDTRIRTWRQMGLATEKKKKKKKKKALSSSSSSSSSNFQYGDDTRIPDEEMIPRKSSYAYQIAKAVQGCHQAGIVLRDLSPYKIGFRRDDPHVVQLFDLGHAVPLSELEDSAAAADDDDTTVNDTTDRPPPASSLVGRRRYMAGEIWRTGQYSKEADVYSWALIFYEMLAEIKPFHGLTAQDHQKLVCGGPAKRPPLQEYCLPQGIESLLVKAWHQCPSMRPSSDRLCQEMQSLVLHLDAVLIYEEEHVTLDPDDFLLEVHVETSTEEDGEDDVSELGDTAVDYDDELLALMQASPVTAGRAFGRTPASAMGDRFVYTGDDDDSVLSSTSSSPLGVAVGLVSRDNSSTNNNAASAKSNDTATKIPSRAPSTCTTTLSSGPENKIVPSAA